MFGVREWRGRNAVVICSWATRSPGDRLGVRDIPHRRRGMVEVKKFKVCKKRRRRCWQSGQQPSEERHNKSSNQHRPPYEQAYGDAFHAECCQAKNGDSGQENGSCGRGQQLYEFRVHHHCDFLPFFPAGVTSPAVSAAILRARRSNCLRSRTSLSTMPSTRASADPPQKRSMIFFTARTATF